MLKDLKQQLVQFTKAERAEITEDEIEILRQMFSVEGSFEVMMRYFCTIESEKGSQIAYDIESLPTKSDNHTAEEVAEEIKFKQMLTRFMRMKLEGLRSTYANRAQKAVDEAEAKIKEEQEQGRKADENAAIEAAEVGPEI